MSGEKERKRIFWYVRRRKKDNRALNIIKRGWEEIAEKIKKMVDELEKKIIKLKTEQAAKNKQKKEIKKEKSSSVCLVCTNQENTFKEESAMKKKENEILIGEIRRLKEENEQLEEEMSERDLELCEMEQRELKLERRIRELRSGPSKKMDVLEKKKKEGRVRPERRKEVERELLSLAKDQYMSRHGIERPPKTVGRNKITSTVERSYDWEPNMPEEELKSRMAQFGCPERPPKTGLLWD